MPQRLAAFPVLEYLVWRTLEGGDYQSIEPDSEGRLESRVFPGLRLNVPALMEGARGQALYA